MNTKNFTETLPNGYAFDMIFIEGGTFQMGSSHLYDNQEPIHPVTVPSFYMGEYLVTQALWEAVMGENPALFKGANHPVEQVSWEDIVNKFLPKLKTMTGKSYQLPSEAMWEYAARGGKHHSSCQYAGSNKLKEVGWYRENSTNSTRPVGMKLPNELGIFDMSGNMGERCMDWYDKDYYKKSPSNNPTGPASGKYRVVRGGCWDELARFCRPAYRSSNTPDARYSASGFRLVFVPPFIV